MLKEIVGDMNAIAEALDACERSNNEREFQNTNGRQYSMRCKKSKLKKSPSAGIKFLRINRLLLGALSLTIMAALFGTSQSLAVEANKEAAATNKKDPFQLTNGFRLPPFNAALIKQHPLAITLQTWLRPCCLVQNRKSQVRSTPGPADQKSRPATCHATSRHLHSHKQHGKNFLVHGEAVNS